LLWSEAYSVVRGFIKDQPTYRSVLARASSRISIYVVAQMFWDCYLQTVTMGAGDATTDDVKRLKRRVLKRLDNIAKSGSFIFSFISYEYFDKVEKRKVRQSLLIPLLPFPPLLVSQIFNRVALHLSFHRPDRGLLSRLWHFLRLGTHVHLVLVERVRCDFSYASERITMK
jgi:hypothetical protein